MRYLVFGGVILAGCIVAGGPRFAAEPSGLERLVQLLEQFDDPQLQHDVLRGLRDALEGRGQVSMPAAWPGVYRRLAGSSHEEVEQLATEVALIFRDEEAVQRLKRRAADPQRREEQRRHAVRVLVEHQVEGVDQLLWQLTEDPKLRRDALVALAAFPSDRLPQRILEMYPRLDSTERQAALSTLVSRPPYAAALLDAIVAEVVPPGDVGVVTARQIQRLEDEGLQRRLQQVWGELRQTSRQKRELMDQYKSWLTEETLAEADLVHGRKVFQKTCMNCHKLFGQGAEIGPDLTGSDRANLDYVLENVLDPSAAVPREYRLTTVVTDQGRVISGLVEQLPNGVYAVQTQDERVLVPEKQVEEIVTSDVSMMPEGLFDHLTQKEIRDIVAYLRLPQPLQTSDAE